tara:strand:+ start:793 stop:2151 length:1359 start_codon:yes stop_codon:yes gene_type:complete
MNRFLIFTIFFFVSFSLKSQSIDAYVLGNSGDYFVNEKSISFTLGESITYTNLQNNYSVFQGFQNVVVSLNEQLFFHNIELPEGWSYWSTYLSPKHSSIVDMFSDISENLVILKDQHGDVYWPYFGIDGIQNHSYGYGYQVKMQQSEILEVSGYKIESPSIQLFENWNILAYLHETPLPVEQAILPLSGEVIIIKDELANVYWPFLGINTIQNMLPGEAYAIKLYSDIFFTYSNINSSRYYNQETNKPIYFNDIINTGDNMTIGIPQYSVENIMDYGDEIGVFDSNDMLVGSAVFEDCNMAITVWGNDFLTDYKDGMIEGESLNFKIWSPDLNKERKISVKHWDEGFGNYSSNGISIVGLFDVKTEDNINFIVSPNPVINDLRITIDNPIDSFTSFFLTNSIGQSELLLNQELIKGTHDFNFHLQKKPGMYYVKISTQYTSQTIPITIINNY